MLGADRSHHAETIDFFVYLAQACTVQHEVRRAYISVMLLCGYWLLISHDNTANLFDGLADESADCS